MVSGEEPVIFDTGYLHVWGNRVKGYATKNVYDDENGSSIQFPTQLLEDRYGNVDLFQFGSTLAVNPYKWGYVDGRAVTSEVVRVEFMFDNGTHVDIIDRESDRVIVELRHSIDNEQSIEECLTATRVCIHLCCQARY